MRLQFSTRVSGHYQAVMARFDRDLFEALKPPGAAMEIEAFTGSRTGDQVRLRFIRPFPASWESAITSHGEDEREAWFVDEGVELPWPLRKWHHRHVVRKVDDHHSEILDDIRYQAHNPFLTWMIWPFLYLAFWPRGAVYRRYFDRIFPSGGN